MHYTSYSDVKHCLGKRRKESHKGDNGRVLVVAGSEEYVGAAALAGTGAMAAMRSGVDLVEVVAPEKVAYAVNEIAPDIISRKLKGKFFAQGHLKTVAGLATGFDVVLIGCGLGVHAKTRQFVKMAVKRIGGMGKPVVLDADALKAVAGVKFGGRGNVLVTPHAREFEMMFGFELEKKGSGEKELGKKTLEKKASAVKAAAAEHNCTVLLKGPVDVISDGKHIKLNKTGNEGMTVGGTGDVLAGLCAGFAALNKGDLFSAACAAAYANGKAGDLLKERMGHGFVASDLLRALPEIIWNVRGPESKRKKARKGVGKG